MEVTLALLCDAANTTPEGKLNVLGTFDRLTASTFPTNHPSMSLVLRFTASPAESGTSRELKIRILEEDGKQLGEIAGQIDIEQSTVPGADAQFQLIFNLPNVPLPKPGRYAFHVLIGDDEKERIPLEVVEVPVEEGATSDN